MGIKLNSKWMGKRLTPIKSGDIAWPRNQQRCFYQTKNGYFVSKLGQQSAAWLWKHVVSYSKAFPLIQAVLAPLSATTADGGLDGVDANPI